MTTKEQDRKPTEARWRLFLLLYTVFLALIFVGAYLGKIPTRLIHIPMYDIIGHFTLLGTASYLSHRALGRRSLQLGPISLPLGPVLVSLLAILEENLQGLSPRRTLSMLDLLANLLGIWLFYGVDWWMERMKEEKADD